MQRLNSMPVEELEKELFVISTSKVWAKKVAEGRPYANLEQLLDFAEKAFRSLPREEWLAAINGHPEIGDMEQMKQKFYSAGECGKAMESVDEETLRELMKYNAEYRKKMGFIFLIKAAGKSPQEMLAALKERVKRTPEEEIHEAVNQEIAISRGRLEKFVQSLSANL